MKSFTRKAAAASLLLGLSLPFSALAADQDLQQKIDALSKEVEALKQDVGQTKKKSLGQWLEIGGDYRARYDSLRGEVPAYFQLNPFNTQANGSDLFLPAGNFKVKNDVLFTNRFGLDLKAKATENVTVTTRLLMYKVSGAQDDSAVRGSASGLQGVGPFFADRAGVFDGTLGHVPTDNKLLVDRVYGTWNNIAGQPIWLSIGRRPSTGGVPSHIRQNTKSPGNSGVPALLVDYAFDGLTLGYAPDIDFLPGAYGKFCFGIGFENGITQTSGNGLRDTHMVGINIVPYDTDAFRAEFQFNRGNNIFDTPGIVSGPLAGSKPTVDLGDIDWYGLDFLGMIKNVGIGNLNWFLSGAISDSHPNGNTVKVQLQTPIAGFTTATGVLDTQSGLMFTGQKKDSTGWAVYVGGRYDIEQTGTKLGFEYNHGSKDWITFTPAADDIWTSKVGTRGNVYEGYLIQELPLKPISSYISKAFFRVGYQYYDFEYTGSNNWVGAPAKIADLGSTAGGFPVNPQFLTPLKTAHDIYATFEVKF